MSFDRFSLNRRDFLLGLAGGCLVSRAKAFQADGAGESGTPQEPIIDIHQHTNYSGRTNADLVAHQRALGVTLTVLLPAGSKYGLDAGCGGNSTVLAMAKKLPKEFVCFGNEVSNLPGALEEIGRYLDQGALGIGEQKFEVACDSPAMERIAELAQERGVPVLIHFYDAKYNTGFARFHRMLEKYPKVNFIGHAQTWWGNIDRNYDQKTVYPTGPVAKGGLTDRYLAEYPNMFGDLSAYSGLNSMIRDEAHARDFLARHQDKLLFGSDCNDTLGRGPGCHGAQLLAAIRRLAPDAEAVRKILYRNAARLLRLEVESERNR